MTCAGWHLTLPARGSPAQARTASFVCGICKAVASSRLHRPTPRPSAPSPSAPAATNSLLPAPIRPRGSGMRRRANPLASCCGYTSTVFSAAFSPDSLFVVTAGEPDSARIWDAASGQEIRALVGHTDTVRSAVYSPDGRFVLTASEDSSARLWDAATGQELRRYRRHTGTVLTVAFGPDGAHDGHGQPRRHGYRVGGRDRADTRHNLGPCRRYQLGRV